MIVLALRLFVNEPASWVHTKRDSDELGSLRKLFTPPLRRRTLGGLFSAMALMVGGFAATTYIPSWIADMSRGIATPSQITSYVSYFAMLLNGGAALGYISLIWLTRSRLGRRGSYFVFVLGSIAMSVITYTTVHSTHGVLWVAALVGFFMLGGFGIFAVYLPELFPTDVRATGQGIVFNFSRIVTGVGTLVAGSLVGPLGGYPHAALLVSLAFIFGLFTIWIAPETRGWTLAHR